MESGTLEGSVYLQQYPIRPSLVGNTPDQERSNASSVLLVVEPSKIIFLIQHTIPQKEDIILLHVASILWSLYWMLPAYGSSTKTYSCAPSEPPGHET